MNSLLRGQSSSKLISQRSQTRSTSYFSSKLKNSSNDAHAGRMGHQCGGRLEIQAGDKPFGRTSWLWWFATHDVISAKWWLYSYSSVFKSNYSDQSKFNFDKKLFFINLKETEKIKKIWLRIGKVPVSVTGFFKWAAWRSSNHHWTWWSSLRSQVGF